MAKLKYEKSESHVIVGSYVELMRMVPIEFKKFENTDFVVQVNEEVDVSEGTFAVLVVPGIELNVVSLCLSFSEATLVSEYVFTTYSLTYEISFASKVTRS